MILADIPPLMYEPPAIVQEVRKRRRSRARRDSTPHRRSYNGQVYRVRTPVGVYIAIGMILILDGNDNETCRVIAKNPDGTVMCQVQ